MLTYKNIKITINNCDIWLDMWLGREVGKLSSSSILNKEIFKKKKNFLHQFFSKYLNGLFEICFEETNDKLIWIVVKPYVSFCVSKNKGS